MEDLALRETVFGPMHCRECRVVLRFCAAGEVKYYSVRHCGFSMLLSAVQLSLATTLSSERDISWRLAVGGPYSMINC